MHFTDSKPSEFILLCKIPFTSSIWIVNSLAALDLKKLITEPFGRNEVPDIILNFQDSEFVSQSQILFFRLWGWWIIPIISKNTK